MNIAIISDLHGNMLAMDALLADLAQWEVGRVYFLGDAVGYMPDGNAVLSGLLKLEATCLLGNHDAMITGTLPIEEQRDQIYKIVDSRHSLEKVNRDFLLTLLPYRTETWNQKSILLTHGSPLDPLTGYVYPDTNLDPFAGLPFDFIFMGHTHRPFIKRAGRTVFVNVGSCGLPRDIGNSGSYAVFNSETSEVTLKRFPLDVTSLLDRYPDIHELVKSCFVRQ